MQKCTNRILSVLLALIMIFTMLPATVLAEGETEKVLEGWSVTLGDNIGVNFYLNSADYTVATTVNGVEVTPAISENVVTVNIAAAQMNDIIVLAVSSGDEIVHTGEYSVRKYAEVLMEGNYSAGTKHMVQSMLDYGAKAQTYFDYNPNNLANAGYELSAQQQIPAEVEEMSVSGQIAGVSFYGATLLFRNQIAVRYYFNADSAEDVEFAVNSASAEVKQAENGLYYVETAGINPQDYEESFVLTATKGEDVLTVSYSPMNYIVRMSAKDSTSDALKSLLSAMYGYHCAADRFEDVQEVDPGITIVSSQFSGTWINTRSEDKNLGPQNSYDGDTSTKWNPQAKTGFVEEPGIIYELGGWYQLDTIQVTFASAESYFIVYTSADGKNFTELYNVNDETIAGAYYGPTASIDASSANTVKYVKLVFTGRTLDNDFVNLHEVTITGYEVAEPDVKAVIMDHNAIGAWVNDQIWDDGTDDLKAGPQLSYDGDAASRWNPQASGGYAQEQGIIYTLDGWYNLSSINLTFSAADMYFAVYGSSDGEVYTELGAVTADNISSAYSGATAAISINAQKIRFIKVMITGRTNGMDFVNLYEVAIYGKQTTAPVVNANIIAHSVTGSWVGQNINNVKYTYDGDSSTTNKWNPQTNSGYSGEPGVIYTLDSYYDLENVALQFSAADMYFRLYGSTDGIGYNLISQVTSANASEYYDGAVCTVDATAGDAIRYLKIVFTGRTGNGTWVNFFEISITGSKSILSEKINPVVDAVISSGAVTGSWADDRVADDGTENANIGPAKSYDGDTVNTMWNPGANSGYSGEPGIIYTLDGWYDLELLKLTVSNANFYFEVYGSSDGEDYSKIAEVTSATQSALRIGNIYTLDLSTGDAVKYVKLIFTGSNTVWVNLYEVSFTGQKVAKPDEESVIVNATITANEVLGEWTYSRVGNTSIGPEMTYDGSYTTKWNPAVKSYSGNEGIIYTLDKAYDLEQLVFTFAAGEIMYMDIYVSADGVDYVPLTSITKDDVSMYDNGVATIDASVAQGVQYIKVIFTGKSSGSTWINFFEFEVTANVKKKHNLTVSGVFSSNMVLQRNQPISVWGWAEEGDTVTGTFAGNTVAATADRSGKWELEFPAQAANASAQTMTITNGNQNVVFDNILIGDVYLISGQSNAELPVGRTVAHLDTESKQAVYDQFRKDMNIRIFHQTKSYVVENTQYWDEPQENVINPDWSWKLAAVNDDFWDFSALGMYFATNLRKNLDEDIPIGLIQMAAGGAYIDELLPNEINQQFGYTGKHTVNVGGYYNTMINPFVGLPISGMLFYQGESYNCLHISNYARDISAFVTELRERWGQEFYFYNVQLSSYGQNLVDAKQWPELPLIRNQQYQALSMLDNYYLTTSMDVGYRGEIDIGTNVADFAHPKDKKTLGERIAKQALAVYYGKLEAGENTFSPVPSSVQWNTDGILISFENADSLALATGDTLVGFQCVINAEIVDVTGQIVNGNQVLLPVDATTVSQVRYGIFQLAYPENANLINGGNLPAPAFILDNPGEFTTSKIVIVDFDIPAKGWKSGGVSSAQPTHAHDGNLETKWNPCVSDFSAEPEITFYLNAKADINSINMTFSARRQYMTIYVSSNDVDYTEAVTITADNYQQFYTDYVCNISDLNVSGVSSFKIVFTGSSDNTYWVNFLEMELDAVQTTVK